MTQTQYFGPGTRLLVLGECWRRASIFEGLPGAVLYRRRPDLRAGSRLSVVGECPRTGRGRRGQGGRLRALGPLPVLELSAGTGEASGSRRELGAGGFSAGLFLRAHMSSISAQAPSWRS